MGKNGAVTEGQILLVNGSLHTATHAGRGDQNENTHKKKQHSRSASGCVYLLMDEKTFEPSHDMLFFNAVGQRNLLDQKLASLLKNLLLAV